MKKYILPTLVLVLLLASCGSPAAEVTPTPEQTYDPMPAYTWWIDPTPTPTPEPTPEPTPFLSYEDYFAQRILFGTDMDDDDTYFEHVSRNQNNIAPGLAFAQEHLEDTEGLIPKTLTWVADRSLYVFWAGTEENLSLYHLYLPSESLKCLYTISAEDMENYYYVPQTEAGADWVGGQVGERVCLLGGTGTYSNHEFFWGHYNKDFLEAYDYVMSHPEEFPQYFEEGPRGDWFDTLAWMEKSDFCNYTVHYINTDSGRQDSLPSGIYSGNGLWWVEELSYEDFLAQKIEYIDTDSDEPYFSPAGRNPYASTSKATPGLALVQELVTEDTLGWIPLTLSYTPDGNLYAFWAGTEEGASLYRLYYPTKTLECLYSITAEEVERYYYTPQTETTACLFRSSEHPNGVVGERVCLMGYVDIYTNQEFLWGSYDLEGLALLDDMTLHKEDYPQYPEWMWDTEDIADWVETKRCYYFNAVTGECRVKKDGFYGAHNYWWVTK